MSAFLLLISALGLNLEDMAGNINGIPVADDSPVVDLRKACEGLQCESLAARVGVNNPTVKRRPFLRRIHAESVTEEDAQEEMRAAAARAAKGVGSKAFEKVRKLARSMVWGNGYDHVRYIDQQLEAVSTRKNTHMEGITADGILVVEETKTVKHNMLDGSQVVDEITTHVEMNQDGQLTEEVTTFETVFGVDGSIEVDETVEIEEVDIRPNLIQQKLSGSLRGSQYAPPVLEEPPADPSRNLLSSLRGRGRNDTEPSYVVESERSHGTPELPVLPYTPPSNYTAPEDELSDLPDLSGSEFLRGLVMPRSV